VLGCCASLLVPEWSGGDSLQSRHPQLTKRGCHLLWARCWVSPFRRGGGSTDMLNLCYGREGDRNVLDLKSAMASSRTAHFARMCRRWSDEATAAGVPEEPRCARALRPSYGGTRFPPSLFRGDRLLHGVRHAHHRLNIIVGCHLALYAVTVRPSLSVAPRNPDALGTFPHTCPGCTRTRKRTGLLNRSCPAAEDQTGLPRSSPRVRRARRYGRAEFMLVSAGASFWT